MDKYARRCNSTTTFKQFTLLLVRLFWTFLASKDLLGMCYYLQGNVTQNNAREMTLWSTQVPNNIVVSAWFRNFYVLFVNYKSAVWSAHKGVEYQRLPVTKMKRLKSYMISRISIFAHTSTWLYLINNASHLASSRRVQKWLCLRLSDVFPVKVINKLVVHLDIALPQILIVLLFVAFICSSHSAYW